MLISIYVSSTLVCDLVNIFNSNSTQTHRGDTNIKHLVYILAHSQYNNGKLMLGEVKRTAGDGPVGPGGPVVPGGP